MWVSTFKWDNRVNGVYAKKPRSWDDETQIGIYVDDESTDTVDTPNGTMLLVDALQERSGAFSIVGGQLVHDDSWVQPEI